MTVQGAAEASSRRAPYLFAAAVVIVAGVAAALLLMWPRLTGERKQAGCQTAMCRSASPERRGAPPLSALPGLPDAPPSAVAGKDVELPADAARRINGAVPFVAGPMTSARPFRFAGSGDDRQRAEQCLGMAMLYEAGTSVVGQRAVAQVVLNRVRHPAYPRTICGVVFQGRERATGCQFTFTCDGALARPIPASWLASARRRAAALLDGAVVKEVGLSTHYHTDWVHPYWSASLDKLAAIDTHLFFRWRGYWGTRSAFAMRYTGGEPPLGGDGTPVRPGVPAETAAAETPETAADATADASASSEGRLLPPAAPTLPDGVPAAALRGNTLRLVHPDDGAFGLELNGNDADALPGVALRLCRTLSFCTVMGWRDAASVPRGFPISPAARAGLSFSYRRDRSRGIEEIRFDCRVYKRVPEQCLGA